MAFLSILSITFLLIPCRTFLLIPSMAFLLRNIMALLFRNAFSPGNLDSVAFLFIYSGCVRLLDSVALLPWFIPTLLLPDGLTGWNSTQDDANQANRQNNLYHAEDETTLPM